MAAGAIADIVRQMTPPRYTVSEAADRTGVSEDTLKRWRKSGVLAPSDSRSFGSLEVPLYTDEDLYAIKQRKNIRSR